jgi:hypothetical protein
MKLIANPEDITAPLVFIGRVNIVNMKSLIQLKFLDHSKLTLGKIIPRILIYRLLKPIYGV